MKPVVPSEKMRSKLVWWHKDINLNVKEGTTSIYHLCSIWQEHLHEPI